MPYSIRLPDGTLVQNIPDEVTPQQAKAKILARRPELLNPKATQPQAQPQPEEEGFFDGLGKSVLGGTRDTAGSLYAAGATALNERGAVVESAKAAQERAPEQAQELQAFQKDIEARKQVSDEGLLAGVKNVVGATVDNPEGAFQLVMSQLPNTAVALGSGIAGAKVGAIAGTAVAPGLGTVIGGTAGFLTGLFAANVGLELGSKAQEKASDGDFTEAERYSAMSEGLTKGATITAVDAATLGASKWLLGTTRRAVESATVRTIEGAGFDAAKVTKSIKEAQANAMAATSKQGKEATSAAVEKATVEAMAREGLTNPALLTAIRESQAKAINGLNTLAKKAGRGGAALSLETVGEGVGEYLGEYAATGEASATDAVLESLAGLSMSLGELRAATSLNKADGVLTGATKEKAGNTEDTTQTTEGVQTAASVEMSPGSTSTTTIERDGKTTTTTVPPKEPAPKTAEEQTAADVSTDVDARIRQRADELMSAVRLPEEVAILVATDQVNAELGLGQEDAQTETGAGVGAGDRGVAGADPAGRPATGESVSVPTPPAPIQSITPEPTGVEPVGVVSDGADVGGVRGGISGEATPVASVGDIATETAAVIEQELAPVEEPTTEVATPAQEDTTETVAPEQETAPVDNVISLGEPVDLTANTPEVAAGEMSPGSTSTTTIERDGEATTTETTVPPKEAAPKTAEEQTQADEEVLGSAEAQAILNEPEVGIEEKIAGKRGGKRERAGRTPANLTPEERAAKEVATSDSKADSTALKRGVAKAEATINEVTDTSGLEGMEGAKLQQEVNTRKEKLQQAVDMLYRLHQRNKGRTQGTRARDLLKNENIPPAMLAEAKRKFEDVGAAAADRGVDVSSASGSTNDTRQTVVDPVNNDIAKAKNAQQLLTVIAKKNAFFKFLAGRLRSFVANVDVVVLETDSVLPSQLLRNIASWNYPDGAVRATGLMVASNKGNDRTIYLRGSSYGKDQGVNAVTALHEVLHAALDRKIKTGMRAVEGGIDIDASTDKFMLDLYTLMAVAESKYTKLKALGLVPPGVLARVEGSKRIEDGEEVFGAFYDPYEFLAYGLTEAPMQSFLKAIKFADKRTAFNRFISAIRSVLGVPVGETNALVALVNVADTVLRARQTKEMQAAYVQTSPSAQKGIGEQKKLDVKVKRELAKLRKTVSRQEMAKQASVLQLLRDPTENAEALANVVNGMSLSSAKVVLKVFTNDGLASVAKASGLPSVEDATNYITSMNGMTAQLMEGAQDTIGNVYRAFAADSTLHNKLRDVIYAATTSNVDPAKNKSSAELNKMWNALGEVGQREYVRLRDYYKTMLDTYSSLLDRQIAELDLEPEQKKKLLAAIRKKYEAQSKIEPYFPLARFGKYYVGFGKAAKREFYMFETRAEQQELLKAIAKERGTTVKNLIADFDDVSVGDNSAAARSEVMSSDSSQELKKLFEAIDNTKFEGDADAIKTELKDAVYQLHLSTLPQQALRNQFQNRKNTAGYDTDVIRAFAKASSGNAYQLARVAYMQRVTRSAKAARKNSKNNATLQMYADELDVRVELELESAASRDLILNKLATYANRAAFFHFLSGISSALLQPMQLITVGFNALGADHGYVATTKELVKLFTGFGKEFAITKKNADGTITYTPPTIRYSKSMQVNEEERRALYDMLGSGVADETLGRELLEFKDRPSADYNKISQKAKRGVLAITTGLMHHSERIAREIILLTSYRLSRKAGKSIEEAKAQAVKDTYQGMGNLATSNRPPIMRGPGGKVAMQFMMFQLYMVGFLLKNFTIMVKPMNGQSRVNATKKLVGTLAATWVVAGASGLPAFSFILGGIDAMVNGLDDDDDDELKGLKEMGFETWVSKVWLPEMVGRETFGGYDIADVIERGPLNAVSGLDFSSRLSLNDMFLRPGRATRTTKEGAIEMAMGATGPFGAQVMSYLDGYDALAMGDYQKATEKFAPAFIRNLAIAQKYATEGAKDFRGAELIAKGDFTAGQMIGQIMGFRPDKVADMQALGFKLSGVEQEINFERTKLLNKINLGFIRQDTDMVDSAFDAIIKFNGKYPRYGIKAADLNDSIKKRADQRAGSVSGVILTEKFLSIPGVADALRTTLD